MTHYLLIAAVAILPVFLLWIYIWRRDARPEPLGQLLKATWWGVLIAIPAVLVETVIEIILFGNGGEGSGWMDNVVSAFCVAAIPEETLKLTALWLVVRKNPYFDEHFDGIVYAVCVALALPALRTYVTCSATQTAGSPSASCELCSRCRVITPSQCSWDITSPDTIS